MISIIQQSPIERYQPHERNFKKPYTETIAFSNEVIAYQIILYSSVDRGEDVSYEIKTSCHSRIYKADYVPVNWVHFESDDKEDYLIDSPGLLPDCLHPIKKEGKLHVCQSLTVLWVEFWFSGAGDKQHVIEFTDSYGKVYETCMNAHIINRGLSTKVFPYVQYIDPHSIRLSYNVPMYSDAFWNILEKYVVLAVENGATSMLVPAYPVHYDNDVCYRPSQLVEIIYDGPQYTFNYDLLDTWLLILYRNGIRRIDLPPVFPSFRNLKCPDFRCQKDYHDVAFFDEGTTTDSAVYYEFIKKFMSKLIEHIDNFPHKFEVEVQISCNGRGEDVEQYDKWKSMILRYLKGKPVAEAMPSPLFYAESECAIPWLYLQDLGYYMDGISDHQKITFDHRSQSAPINFLIAANPVRLRAFGGFAYGFCISWFFNLFYNYSLDPNGSFCDLYTCTDNNGLGPSGSCYLVYPNPRTPFPSMRLKQMFLALQDYRGFRCLEDFYPPLKARNIVKEEFGFTEDTLEIKAEKYLAVRKKIYKLIEKRSMPKK